jgi:hypothetical protein
MIPDDDDRFCARVMIANFGEEAAKVAAARADDYLVAGNTEGQLTWLRVVKAIDELQKMQPNDNLRNTQRKGTLIGR